MQIQLSEQTEKQILKSVNAGDFDRVAKRLAEAISTECPPVFASSNEEAIDRLRESAFKRQSWQEFETFKSAEDLATEQGIGPVINPNDLILTSWPEGEDFEDFISVATEAVGNLRCRTLR